MNVSSRYRIISWANKPSHASTSRTCSIERGPSAIVRTFSVFQFDQSVVARAFLGKVLWLKGLAQAARNDERWFMAELLRVKAELLLLQAAPAIHTLAEHHLQQLRFCRIPSLMLRHFAAMRALGDLPLKVARRTKP